MRVRLAETFGADRPNIAMVHLPALPGRPRHDKAAGMSLLTDTVAREAAAARVPGSAAAPAR